MESKSGIKRNIVNEIVKECFRNHIYTNKDFLDFYVSLLLLDPNWGVMSRFIDRGNIQNFVKTFMSYLIKEKTQLYVLGMQFTFQCYMDNMPQHIEKYRKNLLKQVELLKLNICKATKPKDDEEFHILLKKIVCYITLITGLGNPMEDQVFSEGLAALKSVFYKNELAQFVKLPKEKKESTLLYLSKLVTGIRLFNKDCNIGGAGIPNLHVSFENAVQVVRVVGWKTLRYINTVLETLTQTTQDSYEVIYTNDDYELVYSFKHKEEQTEGINQTLILFKQFEEFIKKLISETKCLEQKATDVKEKLHLLLQKIHLLLENRIAVAVRIVYPLFEQLAECWTEMQNNVISLLVFRSVMSKLQKFANQTNFKNVQLCTGEYLSFTSSLFDSTSLEYTGSSVVTSRNPEVSVLEPNEFESIDKADLQYLGCCPWVLVQSSGALLPGNPNLGFAKYQGKFYSFWCIEAFNAFCKDPNSYVMRVLDLARKKPQFITLLNLKRQLIEVADQCVLFRKKIVVNESQDSQVQTLSSYEDIVPPYKDVSYIWNVWDLKRQAMDVASFSKRQSRLTQTDKTYTRKGVAIQTNMSDLENNAMSVQTMAEKGTNTPTPMRYIFGLRGSQEIVDLDLTLYEKVL